MTDDQNAIAMAMAHDLLLTALIATHRHPEDIEKMLVHWREKGLDALRKNGPPISWALEAAIDDHVQRFLRQIRAVLETRKPRD